MLSSNVQDALEVFGDDYAELFPGADEDSDNADEDNEDAGEGLSENLSLFRICSSIS